MGDLNELSAIEMETRKALHFRWRQAVRRAGEMDPEIWSRFPQDLIPRVLRHLPWWSNMQLRRTSTSWKDLLTDVKFLVDCPPSDERAIPCFTSLTLLQDPKASQLGSQVGLIICCLKARTYNPETEPSGPSTIGRTTWSKWHADPTSLIPSLRPPACCDTSLPMRGKSHSEVAPICGIFLDIREVDQTYRLILMNPFNSTLRQLPPIPPLKSRCSIGSGCSRCAQMIADDENPKNVKIIFPHFAYDDMNIWTLIVYDLVQGSWTTEGGNLPAHLHCSYLSPTSIAMLLGSIYVLVQGNSTGPRLLRFMGSRLSDYPLPMFLHCCPHLYLFRHRNSLMLARGAKQPFPWLDIWRLKKHPNTEQEGGTWERVGGMPEVLLRNLCADSDAPDDAKAEFVKFYVNGDFMSFRPSQRHRSVFLILLDLVKWRWEFIAPDDGIIEGFFICQPRGEVGQYPI